MHIERQLRTLEQIEEVRVYNINKIDLFEKAKPIKKPEHVRFSKIMKHVPSDINVFTPIDDGDDFIIERMGWNVLQRGNVNLSDVEGRKLSESSPFYYEILKEPLKEVYTTGKTKIMRIFYYISDRIQNLTNVHIILDEDEIYVISDYKEYNDNKRSEEEKLKEETESKANLIEYFSQTGSYYKTRNEFTWTPGIYNIINRASDPSDAYYNIIFDLVIPEDRPLVEELLETMSPETDTYENIIRKIGRAHV